MNNKTYISNMSGSLVEKQCSPDGSSDDDILELQKNTLQFIPTQCVTKDNNKIQSVSPPIQFSVDVEEKKRNTGNGIQNGTNSSVQKAHGTHTIETHRKKSEKLLNNSGVKEYYIRKRIMQVQRKTNNYTTVKQCTITSETIMKAIEEQSKENTEAHDKLLDIICKNLHGEFRNINLSFYDEEVNKIIKIWRRWHRMSPWFRSTPLMYKCYICYKGWWRMHPFKEHLKSVHSDPHITLGSECITDEFSIIASATEDFNVKDVEMDSDCWKCGRDAAFHKRTNLKPAQYECSGCNKYMATCTILKQHESTCSKYIGIHFKKYNVEASKGVKCPVCMIFCVSTQALDAHIIDYHLVRSDEPVILESKVCPLCCGRYIISAFHDCPAKPKRYKCKYCGRTFSTQTFLDIHIKYSRGSSVSQCVVLDHHLKNSKNYCLMYMCSKCETNVLLKNETIFGTHGMIHNNRFPSRLIVLPTKCLSGKFVKSEKTFQIKDERLIGFLAGIIHLKDIEAVPVGMTTISTSEKIQSSMQGLATHRETGLFDGYVINLDDDDDVRNNDKDDEVINIDDDHDDVPPIESAQNPENFGDDDSDIKAMQVQLDEEIMRDLEVEATISKVFEASKSYQLLMEKETLEKVSEKNQLLKKASKTRQLIEKKSIKEEKESVNGELISEESLKKESIKIEEDGDKYENDLMIPVEVVEEVNTNKTDIKNEIDLEDNDIKMVISGNSSDSKQNQNCDTSTIVMEESSIYDDTIKVEPEVFIQQKVKLEPSEHLTKMLYEDMVQVIASNQRIQDMDDVNMESFHECEECSYSGEWSRYIEHVSMECPGTEFSCNLCIKSIRYQNLNHYLQHLTEHDYLPHSCPECQVQHKSLDELHTHVTFRIQELFSGTKSMKRQDMTLYHCNKCGLAVQPKLFLKHWQMCFNEKNADSSEEDISDECSDVSMGQEKIKEVMKIIQSRLKKHKVRKCMVCSRKFKSHDRCKRHLIEHLLHQAKRRKRNENEKLRCFYCDTEFKVAKELRSHMLNHSHMRVHKCEICLKNYSNAITLNRHRKLHV